VKQGISSSTSPQHWSCARAGVVDGLDPAARPRRNCTAESEQRSVDDNEALSPLRLRTPRCCEAEVCTRPTFPAASASSGRAVSLTRTTIKVPGCTGNVHLTMEVTR
jgi:hypothetical protein